jgi:predicted peptidase
MMRIIYVIKIACLFLLGCQSNSKTTNKVSNQTFEVKLDSIVMFDNAREREVPVVFYLPKTYKKITKQPIIIFSHGYYQNAAGSNKKYSYITERLASKGYFVASIQHELLTDSLIPKAGIPQIVRRPFWNRGADNIFFVIAQLKQSNPDLDFKHITLIGHSNGADMTALFPQKYPNVVDRIITLDNRRMLLPKSKQVKVYSIRSSDQAADEGVLPSEDDAKKYSIRIVKLTNTIHNHMDNNANEVQRKEINDYILSFLNDN